MTQKAHYQQTNPSETVSIEMVVALTYYVDTNQNDFGFFAHDITLI